MASNSLSLNSPPIFTDENYQILSVRRNPYFETCVICEIVMNEKPLQLFSVQTKAILGKRLQMTMSPHVLLKNKSQEEKNKRRNFESSKTMKKVQHQLPKQKIRRIIFFQLQ